MVTAVRINWRLVVAPFILVIVALCQSSLESGGDDKMRFPNGSHLRFMTYNIHQGANTDGMIDLEGLARTIETQKPDVVVLQEVVRGQLVTGSTDSLSWLARRLDMNYRFAPATDATYGEALLSRFYIRVWDTGKLFQGDAAQPRSYIYGLLELGPEGYVTVIGTHLDHTNSTVRNQQVKDLLRVLNMARPGEPLIIAGDMNSLPNSPEIAMFKAAGLQDAQDATGNSTLFTFPSTGPRIKIDYIFGSPDLTFSDFVIPQSTASDHLPVAVTVNWNDSP